MNKKLIALVLCLSLMVVFAVGCSSAPAEPAGGDDFKYPTESVEMVVHTNPGDGVYLFMQTLADELSKDSDERFNIVIKSGGSGANAMQYLKTKEGNNHVLCSTQPSTITTPLKNNLDIKAYEDFTPVAGVIAEDYVVVVRQDSPYKTFQDLIDDAKANPGKVTQGSGVLGANDTVISAIIEETAGIDLNLVPFKDGGLMMVGLLAGDVDFISANPSEILEQIKAGKIRPLAIAAEERLAALPDVPTMKEFNLDIVFQGFRGIMGPKGMDPKVVEYLEGKIQEVIKTDGWQKYLLDNAVSDVYKSSSELEQHWKNLDQMYIKMYKDMGLRD